MSEVPPIAAEPAAAPGDRRRLIVDLASSYALSVARVASMAAMVAIFYRYTDAHFTAAFILCRTTVSVLNYFFAGLGPSTLHAIHEQRAEYASAPVAEPAEGDFGGRVIAYRDLVATASPRSVDPTARVYASASVVGLLLVIVGVFAVPAYASSFAWLHSMDDFRRWSIPTMVVGYGFGLLARLLTEPAAAVLQANGRLSLDNVILSLAEVAWPLMAWNFAWGIHNADATFEAAASQFLAINVIAGVARVAAARATLGMPQFGSLAIDLPIAWDVLRRAALTSIGSFADFLYAPFNLILINAALGAVAVADYTPALQFDAALLLLVGAIAATILPRAMRLAGDLRDADLRALYLRSTLVSLAILAVAAIGLWVAAPAILRVWLGEPMPVTLSVLPLVLVHTVVGGTAGVGRAVLLAMGRFRAYTVSAVVGGVANVALALLFVVGFGWGLRGVALATIVAVVARCAIWMPWYVLRATRPAP